MDMNLILFIFITTCVLSLLTYAEWVYKRKKKESDRDIRIRRMNGWIDQARRQRKNKERAEKEGLINYLTKFKL